MNDTLAPHHEPPTEALERWKAAVLTELKGASFEKRLVTRTFEGLSLQPLYTRLDAANLPDVDTLPGQAPFLRGVRPSGYANRPWEVAQEIEVGPPAAFNAALLTGLAHGQNCVVLDPGARRPSIAGLADLTAALDGVDLGAVAVHVRGGADPGPLGAAYLELAGLRGAGGTRLSGGVTGDPLGAWSASGSLPDSLDALYDSLAGWTVRAAAHAPRLRTIGVDGAQWGDGGATAVQEVAFALAAATDYLRALSRRGLSPEVAGERMHFRLSIGPQFFMELAKFRAFRPLWTRVLAAFGAPSSCAARATVHASTGRWNKTLLDPHVNLLRVVTEGLSAVLGGCDGLTVAPFDEVAGATDDFSRRIARNVHTLLAEEFGLSRVADAAGGSWYVEKLTDGLARESWALFQAIEGHGGWAAALADRFPQQQVGIAVAEKSDAVSKRRLGLIGTNLFPNLKEPPLPIQTPVAAAAVTQPPPGGHRIVPVAPWRAAARFEALRAGADAFLKRAGHRPRVFLAKMGPTLQHKGRADFSTGFFAVGGFEVMSGQAFERPEAAAGAAAESGAPIVVLCSTDETYPVLVPAFAAAVRALGKDIRIVLAGLPADPAVVTAFREAGVDEFIHLRADVPEVLARLFQQIGATA